PNTAGGLGSGYPLLVASAVLAERATRELQFYNRGVSGNKVPDLQQRWITDTLDLKPDVMSILIGVNDFWHTLTHGYTGTVQDYEQQYTALLDDTRRALPRGLASRGSSRDGGGLSRLLGRHWRARRAPRPFPRLLPLRLPHRHPRRRRRRGFRSGATNLTDRPTPASIPPSGTTISATDAQAFVGGGTMRRSITAPTLRTSR